jgi:hypothetical protein
MEDEMKMAWLGVSSLVVTLASMGCSTNATIFTRGSEVVEAEILGGDATSLHVLRDDGQEQDILREDVQNIDHPGKVAAVLGTLVSIGGIILVINGAVGSDPDDSDTAGDALFESFGEILSFVSGMAVLAVYVPVALWGYTTWSDSAEAAEPPPESVVQLDSLVVMGNTDRGQLGVGIRFRW